MSGAAKRGHKRIATSQNVEPLPSFQIMHFNHKQREQFIGAAVIPRPIGNQRYAQVKLLGNASTAGRYVEARLIEELSAHEWDLFKGERYDSTLAPTDAFPHRQNREAFRTWR
jgi:hypothetical protein